MARPWTRLYARFALAVMLALTLLPSFGRLLQPAVAMDVAMVHALAMDHTMAMAGESCHDMPAVPDDAPRRGHPPPAREDCAYCPLLAALALPTLDPWLIPALAWRPDWATAGSIGRAADARPAGLGARGPPAAA